MTDISTAKTKEKAVLVGIIHADQDNALVAEYLDELAFLVETAGADPVKTFTQKIDAPNPKTFVGSGKLEEISRFLKVHDIKLVVFDDELSPSQLRNIERELQVRILDRTNLILDIFAGRAKTAHAKTQVELAQYQYLLPRLTRMWTHLERQRGGIGMRGPGETEIETDRRIIRDKIAKLKDQLAKIDKQMATQRKNRGKMIRVSLVGYTNVGKSTIMNLLSKSSVFAENKLFATLDTTVRKVVIGNLPFLLSDTVGFIRKLPHSLVESFKSTLDEVRESDILLHVVDISHSGFEEQIDIVNQTLQEIGAANKPVYMVFNKIDAYKFAQKDADDLTPRTKENRTLEELKKSWMAKTQKDADDLTPRTKENRTLEELKKSWMAKTELPCIFISALQKRNVDAFKKLIYDHVREIHVTRYPYDNFLYEDVY
jgi:GTP-binding protein HflX